MIPEDKQDLKDFLISLSYEVTNMIEIIEDSEQHKILRLFERMETLEDHIEGIKDRLGRYKDDNTLKE